MEYVYLSNVIMATMYASIAASIVYCGYKVSENMRYKFDGFLEITKLSADLKSEHKFRAVNINEHLICSSTIYDGKLYKIYSKIDRQFELDMLGKTVQVQIKDNVKDITQIPGISYAHIDLEKDFGATAYRINGGPWIYDRKINLLF